MEEKKNQEQPKEQLAPDGKPRVVTETIPEEYVKMLDEKKKERQGLLNQMLQVSFSIAQAQKAQQNLLEKIGNLDQSLKSKLEWVLQKMKLNRAKDRNWRYDGKNGFIGIYNPPKPKKK